MIQPKTQEKKDKGRFSTKRQTEAVLRLLQGEDIDTLSRELGGCRCPPEPVAG